MYINNVIYLLIVVRPDTQDTKSSKIEYVVFLMYPCTYPCT